MGQDLAALKTRTNTAMSEQTRLRKTEQTPTSTCTKNFKFFKSYVFAVMSNVQDTGRVVHVWFRCVKIRVSAQKFRDDG